MKCILVISVFSLLLYVIALPIQQYRALHQADIELAAGEPERADVYLEQVRQAWPVFYPERARSLCSAITLARAQRLVDRTEPDFGGAASLAHALATRCETPEREGEATRLVEHIATLHLARATTRCQKQAFAASLADFQHIAILPYPARSLEQAQAEAALCRLEFAKVLTTQEHFEAAIEQLQRVISTEQGTVREAALKQVPAVVGEEIRDWLARQQYPQAFKRLGQRQASFGEYPETASFFADLGRQVEYEVFGVVLTRQCRQSVQPLPRVEKPVKKGTKKPPPKSQGAVIMADAPDTGPISSASTANLLLRNDTGHLLQVLVRGQERRDVPLAPQATQELQLDPAEYVVGIYSPGNCQVQPKRSTWPIRSAPYSVRFYEG